MKETLKTLGIPAFVAMCGSLVRYVRQHRKEPFDWREFISGMICSGFIGIVSYGLCDALGFSQTTSSAVVAMAGYCGGTLLDVLYKGIIDSVDEFIKALIERIKGL